MDEWEVPREERAYLVVDDAQVLVGDRMPPGNSEQGVAPLLRLADHCRRNVGIVLIARSAWPAQLTDLIGDGSPMPLLAEGMSNVCILPGSFPFPWRLPLRSA